MQNTTPVERSSPPSQIVQLRYGRDDVEPVDLYKYLNAVWRRKWLVALVMIVGAAAGVAAALLTTPVYRAEALVLPVAEEKMPGDLGALGGQFSGLAALAGISISVGSDEDEALAMLKSRQFMEQFVNDQKLMPVLFADKWDAGAGQWIVSDQDEVPTLWDAYELISNEVLTVAPARDTGLVIIAVEWKDPELAANWANLLIARVNDVMRGRAMDEADRSLDALNAELEQTGPVELRQAIFKLAEAQIQKRILAKVRNEYSFRVIDPARAPDSDQFVRPKKVTLVALGLILGIAAGLALALLLEMLAQARRPSAMSDNVA